MVFLTLFSDNSVRVVAFSCAILTAKIRKVQKRLVLPLSKRELNNHNLPNWK